MGHVCVDVTVGDPDKKKLVRVRGLVDTGATLTVLPRRLAEEIGLCVTGKSVVETGSGRAVLDRSRAWIEIEGRGEVVPILISDDIDKVLIGVTTLEILGLEVDPVAGKLREWTLLLYYHC